jgi:UDP-N-acetylglucosamine 2-epimerase (non-hydrolysing)
MASNLTALRRFIEDHDDVALIFPVHPNPSVHGPSTELLFGHRRIHLIPPLNYRDFVHLLSHAWLIVSDSGGVQEEAPTLGKPLLILRENTERPEAVECGIARLVGGSPERLGKLLDEVYGDQIWTEDFRKIENPFGQGDSAKRIVKIIANLLNLSGNRADNAPDCDEPRRS